MGFIITATAIANTFAAIFQCSPVHAAWQGTGSDDAKQAKCLNMAAFDEYMAIPNVITGAVMILMPLPPVLRLNVATLQKVALSATFLHGAMYDNPLLLPLPPKLLHFHADSSYSAASSPPLPGSTSSPIPPRLRLLPPLSQPRSTPSTNPPTT